MGRLNFLYKMDLPHRAKLVYIYLRDRMDKEKKAWPGLNTIAKDLSLSRSTVKRAIKDLEKAGLIRKEPHYRENGSAPRTGIICFKKSIFTHKGVVCLSCGLRGGSLWTSLKSPL